MDQKQRGFRRVGRRQAIGLGLVPLAAVIAIGVIVAVAMRGGDSVPTDLSQADLQKEVDKATAKKDYKGAAQIVADQQSAASGDKQTQLKLAVAYYNAAEYKKALDIYDQLNQAGDLDTGYVTAAAETAEQAGDKAAAIKYYQLAKKRAQAENSPTMQAKVESYDRKITELGD